MRRHWVFTLLLVFSAALFPYGAPAGQLDNDAYQAGLEALRADKPQEAIEDFSRAIAANPGDHRYYNDRGVAYKRTGNLEKAVVDYSKSLEINPGYTHALNNRGVVYLQQGLYDQAIADFSEALKHGGLEGTLYTNRGIASAAKGDHQAAIEDFNQAISFGSMDPRAFLFMGDSLEKTGSLDKALKMYQLALGLVKEASVTDHVEKRIAAIENVMGLGTPQPGAAEAVNGAQKPKTATQDDTKQDQRTVRQSPRQIVRARPMHDADLILKKEAPDAGKAGIGGLAELNGRCQTKALSQLSPASVEIYRQGLEFVEKSDWSKALVRFEDTRQLERRNQNPHAVFWCDLEIGRVYSRRGDYAKAGVYIEEAFKGFNKSKSKECALLALVALATNEKSAGRKDRASSLYARSVEEAASYGWYALARSITDFASGKKQSPATATAAQPAPPSKPAASASKPTAPPVAPSGVKTAERREAIKESGHREVKNGSAGHGVDKKHEKADTIANKVSPGLANVGRGPVAAQGAGNKLKSSPQPGKTAERAPSLDQKPRVVEARVHPEREVLGAHGTVSQVKPPQGQEKAVPGRTRQANKQNSEEVASAERIRHDLAELRKLRQAGEQQKMIPVLDRLSAAYAQNMQFDKALQGIAVSIAFREKFGSNEGAAAALEQRATLQEKLGRPCEAIEDYTKALAMYTDKQAKGAKALEAKITVLAQSLGLNSSTTGDAFRMLWDARLTGTGAGETRALYLIGESLDRAGRNEEALRYYNRAAASMLMDEARIYNRMGQTGEAEKLHAQAMETLKTVDHARYLEVQRRDQPMAGPGRQQ